jgi:hypothetical protein
MAYPSVTSPYGLLPINLIGGQVFAGSTRQIPIATNSATAIYGVTFRQFYPGTTNISDITAYVLDDPDALFKVAVCAGTNSNTVSYLTQAAVGSNVKLANGANNTGSTITGNSKVGVDSTEGTSSAWPIRVIDVVHETAIAGSPGSYTEVIVKWNQGMHQYLNPLGLA